MKRLFPDSSIIVLEASSATRLWCFWLVASKALCMVTHDNVKSPLEGSDLKTCMIFCCDMCNCNNVGGNKIWNTIVCQIFILNTEKKTTHHQQTLPSLIGEFSCLNVHVKTLVRPSVIGCAAPILKSGRICHLLPGVSSCLIYGIEHKVHFSSCVAGLP